MRGFLVMGRCSIFLASWISYAKLYLLVRSLVGLLVGVWQARRLKDSPENSLFYWQELRPHFQTASLLLFVQVYHIFLIYDELAER